MKSTEESKKYGGRNKIILSLRTRSRTLEELHKESKLTKPTILYHLKNLMEKGFVIFDEYAKNYKIKINENVRNSILDALRTECSFDEAFAKLNKKLKSEKNNSELQSILNSKDAKTLLKDFLDFFYDQHLIIYNHRFDRWSLSWIGCVKINACYICKNYFSPHDVAIAQTINFHDPDSQIYSDSLAALIHPKCFIEKYDPIGAENIEDLCDFCGLPLSKERYMWFTGRTMISFLNFILRYLSKNEEFYLRKYIKNQIMSYYNKTYQTSFEEHNVRISDDFIIYVDIDKYNAELFPEFSGAIKTHNYDIVGNYELKSNFFHVIQGFVYNPKLSDIDHLFYLINEFVNQLGEVPPFHENRAKEIFSLWNQHELNAEKFFDGLLANPISLSYSLMENVEPRPHESAVAFFGSEYAIEQSMGYSFIHIENGKRYHPYCYNLVNENKNSKQTKDLSEG